MTTTGRKMRPRLNGAELRATLARHRLRQEDLGAAAGISRPYVSLITQGLQPSAAAVGALVRGLRTLGVPEREVRSVVKGAVPEEAPAAKP